MSRVSDQTSAGRPGFFKAKDIAAEPFRAFMFSPAGASVYQLGTFGTARKELKALTLVA